MQFIAPDERRKSLLFQSIALSSISQPFLFATSFASSMSKPVYSPLSPTYPYGGKSASNPTIKVFFFDPHEQRAMQKSPIANASDIILTTDFFFFLFPFEFNVVLL